MATTLTDIITDVAQKASIDTQNQVNMNNLIRWVNNTLDDVCQAYPWPWLHERYVFPSVVDITGTVGSVSVDCTNGSNVVTGTGTSFTAAYVGRFIQFSSSNDWYKITAVSSTTSLTIETEYAPATEASMDFRVRKVNYDLPTDMTRIIDIRQSRTPAKLVSVDVRTFDMFSPLTTSVGNPRAYYVWAYNNPSSLTGQNYAVTLFPVPDQAMIFEVRYIKRPPQLSAGTDIPAIPQIFADILVTGTLVHAYQWQNSPNTGGQKQQFKDALKDLIGKMPQTEDNVDIIQACDTVPGPMQIVPFPSQYGYPYSY